MTYGHGWPTKVCPGTAYSFQHGWATREAEWPNPLSSGSGRLGQKMMTINRNSGQARKTIQHDAKGDFLPDLTVSLSLSKRRRFLCPTTSFQKKKKVEKISPGPFLKSYSVSSQSSALLKEVPHLSVCFVSGFGCGCGDLGLILTSDTDFEFGIWVLIYRDNNLGLSIPQGNLPTGFEFGNLVIIIIIFLDIVVLI